MEKKLTFSEQYFGKRLKDLTPEERKEYDRIKARLWKRKNYAKKREEKIANGYVPHENSLVYQMFGKKLKDLTIEEKRAYYREHDKKRRTNMTTHDKSLVRQMFGKKAKELTAEELNQYKKHLSQLRKEKKLKAAA